MERKIEFAVQNVECKAKGEEAVEVNTLLMYSGEFVDAGGQELVVKPELLYSLARRYDEYLAKPLPGESAIKKLFGVRPERLYKPVSLNHEKDDAMKIIGRVMSLEVKEHDDQVFLFGKMRILGKDNVDRVKDRRLTNVSISFDYDDMNEFGDLIEISYVFDGAVEGARSFSKPSIEKAPTMYDFKRVEMGKVALDIQRKSKSVKQLEIKLKRLYNMKSVCVNLSQMVKDGLISRADMKRLAVDVQFIDLSKSDVYLRMVRTIAMSRKQQRGQVSNNLQMVAFESFMDSVVENGGKMKKGLNPKEFAKQAAAHINKLINKTEVNASNGNMHESEGVMSGMRKEQAHEESEHVIKFTTEDMERMADMARKGMKHELLDFMGDCSGMDFEYDDDSEDNDEVEHHKKGEGYKKESEEIKGDHRKNKKKGEDFSKEDAEEEAEEESEEHEAEGDPGSRDYSKDMLKDIDAKILSFSKELSVLKDSIATLNDTLVAMSGNTNEGDK